MKKLVLSVLVVMLTATMAFAVNKVKPAASDEDKKPMVVVTGGQFTGSMQADGSGRSVVIVNTYTGDFEVFDIDKQAMDRKSGTNEIYYSSIKYNHKDGTRQVVKYKLAEDVKAGEEKSQDTLE